MKRRILGILIALALCLSLCPTWAFAEEWEAVPDVGVLAEGEPTSGTFGDNLTWSLVDGVLTIGGTGEMPGFYMDCPWKASTDSIKKVIIENGVTSIGKNAFLNCDVLQSVEIPGSVTSLGYQAFASCDTLASIDIPEGVTLIDGSAFQGCWELSSITIPASVTKIGQQAFSQCDRLTSVTFAGRTAPTLGWIVFDTDDPLFPSHRDPLIIHVPHGAEGYTEENGWPVDSVTPDPNHTFDENGLCVCGEQAAAKVEAGSGITYHSTIDEAWTVAKAAKTATITLLDDVNPTDGLTMKNNEIFILDLNGKTITSAGNVVSVQPDASLTVKDSGGNGKIISTGSGAVGLTGGTLILEGGSISGGQPGNYAGVQLIGDGASIEVTGSAVKVDFLVVQGGQNLSLTAGTYGRIWVRNPLSLASLLGENHAYYGADGKPLVLDGLGEPDGSTTVLTGPVTVRECTHPGVKPTPNNDGTHSTNCPYCGYTEAADCVYGSEYKKDETNHTQTCTACGYEKVEAHTFSSASTEDEGLITFLNQCNKCWYKEPVGTAMLTIPAPLVYRQTGGKTISVETDMPNEKITLKLDSGEEVEAASIALPADLSVGRHRVDTSIYTSSGIEHLSIVYFTVDPAPLTDGMVTFPEDITYSGAAQTPATVQDGETALVEGTDYEIAYSNNTNAGTATVTVTGKGNYTGTVTKTFTIEKAAPNVTAPTAGAIEYGQKLSDSALTGGSAVNPVVTTTTVAGSWSWVEDTQPAETGTFPAAFTPTDTANYETPDSVDVSVTVNPATPEITVTAPAYQNAGKEVTVTYGVKNPHDAAKDDLPAVTLTYSVGGGAPQAITGGKFEIPEDAADGTVITITATTAAVDGKYSSTSVTTIVTVTDKIPVEITGVGVAGRVYNGEPISTTGTPVIKTLEGVTVTGAEISYAWSSGTAPVNAGDYSLEITVNDGTYIGKTTVSFTIAKATVTITAENKSAVAGSAQPELTYTVSGLVGEDTLATAPTLTCDPDMNTVGSYPITAGGAAVPGGGNYNVEIVYVQGTLTVTAPIVPDDGGESGNIYVPFIPGSFGAPVTTPAVTVPVSGDANTVRVSASVSGSAATVSRIDTTQIESVIGGGARSSMVEIDFTGLGRAIDTVHLPTAAIAEIAAAAQNDVVGGLTVKLSDSEISLDGDALAAIQAQAGSQVTLIVTPAKGGDLNARQKEAVGSAQVYDLTIQSNGRAITDFRGGYVTASLPYALAAGQAPDRVVVYYLDSMGNITPCATTYDAGRQAAVFTTSHLSLYFVGYDPEAVAWVNPFSDAAEGAWYYDAVRFVNENGLMNGYSNGTFGPDNYLSRAMLAQILYNREGAPAVTGGSAFTDAAPGQWYTSAVAWAAANGIVGGYGDGRFGPNDNITREQLAVMLWRYAGSPAAAGEELAFHDADRISGYALDAMRWAVENGILNGYGDGLLGPQGLATRAQVAQMLKNYMEQ
ncbi:MAG: leucine-rich repeat protein [Oscillibacter sp.]|nr:leucine-rich repeat protein [Oscillibacter sp.]